jgi:hypothetical protein
VRQTGDWPKNDGITLGQAPFGSGQRIISQGIWTIPPDPIAKTLTIQLTAAALNTLNGMIFRADNCNVPIDLYVEDDTEVDSAILKIWTY